MPFGIDPVKIAKAELKKVDLDHDGNPDVIEALSAIEKGAEALGAFAGRYDVGNFAALLRFLNAQMGAKVSDAEIAAAAAALVALPAALKKLDQIIEAAKKELNK